MLLHSRNLVSTEFPTKNSLFFENDTHMSVVYLYHNFSYIPAIIYNLIHFTHTNFPVIQLPHNHQI